MKIELQHVHENSVGVYHITCIHFRTRSALNATITWGVALPGHIKESRFQNPENNCLWDPGSWTLESGIQLKESGIRVLLTKSGIQYLGSRIRGVESRIQDCLGFP